MLYLLFQKVQNLLFNCFVIKAVYWSKNVTICDSRHEIITIKIFYIFMHYKRTIWFSPSK